jgi:hypothetical protein
VRRHAKAPSAFICDRGFVAVVTFTLTAIFALSLLASSAQAAPLGITGFFGNSGAAGGSLGGEFGVIPLASGSAPAPAGIAVNDTTGDIYVVDAGNNRLQRFDADGNFEWALGFDVIASGKAGNQPQSEVQEVRLRGAPTGGTFVLSYTSPTNTTASTAPIPFNATAAQVQTALEGLAAIGTGNVAVSVAPGGNPGGEAGVAGGPWRIEFTGALADINLVGISGNASGLTPAGKSVFGTTPVEGAAVVEKCTVAANCKSGTPTTTNPGTAQLFASTTPGVFSASVPGGGFQLPQGIAIDQATGDLYLSDFGFARIQQLNAEGGFIRAWGIDVARSGATQADERQRLAVSATAGQYKLGYYATHGRGQISNGSATITSLVTFVGSFAAGQPITGPGIPEGTTILSVGAESLTLSAPASASAGNGALSAGPFSMTADIEWNEAAAGVEAKLAAAGIGAANVSVTGGPGGSAPYLVSFGGALADVNIAPLVVSAGTTPLSGGTGAAIATFNEGAEGFEVCEAAPICSRGRAVTGVNPISVNGGNLPFTGGIGYLAVAPATAPNAGNVIVGDGQQRRVQEFSPTGQFVRAFGWDVIGSGPGDTGTEFEVCRATALDICKGGTIGAGLGQFGDTTFSSAVRRDLRIAVDASGAIYVLEAGACSFASVPRRVQKFTPQVGSPELVPSVFAEPSLSATSSCFGEGPKTNVAPQEIAIDPADGHVYVVKSYEAGEGTPPAPAPERRLLEFDATGALLETHLAGYNLGSVNGLALESGGEAAYLTSASPKPGVNVAGPPTPPSAAIEPTADVGSSCATLHGTVNPNGGGAPLPTSYRFEYRPVGATEWAKTPTPDAAAGGGEAPVAVEQSTCGLEPNQDYEVRLVAIKGGSPVFSSGNAGDFSTDPAPPIVQTFNAFYDANDGELVLRGAVNPNNTATTYYFQYGTAPCSANPCTSVPEAENAPAGSDGVLQLVSRSLADLEPDTTYHFRLVADNGVEASPGESEVKGADLSFTTPAAGPAPCPNEQFRTGASARLAECRAFEWVSDGDSWGSAIGSAATAMTESGNRALFNAQAFGQPLSVPGPSTPYVADRGPDGWAAVAMAPSPDLAAGSPAGTRYTVAADLGATLWPQSSLGQRIRNEVRWGTIGRDGSQSWLSDLLVPVRFFGNTGSYEEYHVMGASEDLTSALFAHTSETGRSVALMAGEPLVSGGSNSNLYRVSEGNLEVVNRDSAAVTPDNPLGVIGACGAGLGASVGPRAPGLREGAVSADGSVIHFSVASGAPAAPGPGCGPEGPKRLFKRIDGTTTVEVSACAKSNPANCTAAGADKYRGASRDGGVTFFASPRQLTDSDSDATQDLYAYDESLPPAERLVQASAGEAVAGDHPLPGAGADVQNVLANSDDGSRVYFVARGRLTPAAAKGAENLYVFERGDAHPGGRTAFIGALASDEAGGGEITETVRTAYPLPAGGDGDGRTLLFTSVAKLLGEDLDAARDLYRYEDSSGQMTCLSCMGEEDFGIGIETRSSETSVANAAQQAHPANSDGSRVVFTTQEGLIGEDTNGATDAYLWSEGSLSLISAGSEAAGVVDAQSVSLSADGRDVFFITRTAMVGSDTNNGLDLYDARLGGGFAEPVAPDRCAGGEACQGPVADVPGRQSAASVNFVGPGNPKQPRKCGKGKVRRGGKCVKRQKAKADKHKKSQSKRANNKRGGHR